MADLQAVIEAQESSGRQYMMMETTVFSREYLYVRGLLETGLGLSFGRNSTQT